MNISPRMTGALAKHPTEASSDGSPAVSLVIAQVVQCAAHAVECPTAVFFRLGERGFEVSASFGIDVPVVAGTASQLLAEVAQLSSGGLLVVNDVACQPGFAFVDAQLFGDDMPPVQFIAARAIQF